MNFLEVRQPTSIACQFAAEHFRGVTKMVHVEIIHIVGVNKLV